MAIVRVGDNALEQVRATSLATEGLRERQDLQRLLKQHIEVIDPDLLVIAEEFGDWEDSRRRIDLLAIDRDANLVVIELKRDSSTHMELQALRYAAMVAPLSFAQVVDTYSRFLQTEGSSENARELLEDFLSIEDQDEPTVADVRVILVCGSFSKELTTAVLWLNERDLDIGASSSNSTGSTSRLSPTFVRSYPYRALRSTR